METYKVRITESAERDLNGIYRFIADELGSEINAMNQYKRLMKTILSLEFMPDRIRLMDCEPKLPRDYRRINVDNYAVIFEIVDDTVFVDRVLYGASDIESKLR